EDGIRDYKVTGVQTCALPIYQERHQDRADDLRVAADRLHRLADAVAHTDAWPNSDEADRQSRRPYVRCSRCRGSLGKETELKHEIGRASCRERERSTQCNDTP